jgi:uncharacterized protein YjiS (DUF1127 family)
MLNSSKAVNGLARPRNVPSCELSLESSNNGNESLAQASRLDLPDVNSPQAAISTITPVDRQTPAPWSSIFSFLMEGFTLYGALLYSTASFPTESEPSKARVGQTEEAERERRGSFAVVRSTANPEVRGLASDTNRSWSGSRVQSEEDAGLAGSYASPGSDADESNRRDWLSRSWCAVACRWRHWHREREIKQIVAALAEFDDRTLRDMGIPHRFEIERVVRYCRGC